MMQPTVNRILIVEDDPFSRDILSRRLTRRGYEVLEAHDGAEGILVAQTRLPDLILMDIDLAEIDGLEATRRLKKDKVTTHIPIIALTAYAMAEDRSRARQVGCDDFDTKPVDLSRLLEKIVRLLPPTS